MSPATKTKTNTAGKGESAMTDDFIFIKAAAVMAVVFVVWMVWRSRPRKSKDWPPGGDY